MVTRVLSVVFSLILLMTVSSCYMDSIEDRPPAAPGHGDGFYLTEDSGSFEGSLPPDRIYVDGVEFNDINELATRFDELDVVSRLMNYFKVDKKSYTVRLLTKLDNGSFAKGFEVYLRNEYTSKSVRVPRSGTFKLKEIPEGDYEIRIQKQLPFSIEPFDSDEVNSEDFESRIFCASIFTEDSIEVIAGEHATRVFEDYELSIPNRECKDSEIWW